MKCSYHPNTETNLRCSKCEKPICPRCMIYTPVGARCPDCAAVKRLPIYDVSPAYYTRAVGAGLAVALVLGLIWALLGNFSGMFSLLVVAGLGYVIGEGISISVNRKRGLGLQIIAGVSVILAFVIHGLVPVLASVPQLTGDLPLFLQMAGRVLLSIVTNPWNLVSLGIALFIALRRL